MNVIFRNIIIIFLLLLYPFLSHSAPLLEERIVYNEIKDMTADISQDISFAVIHISQPINNISAVAINPPYREFPNIILFEYSEKKGRWTRVFEWLSIGIQHNFSLYRDMHILGKGADIQIQGEPNNYEFDEKVKDLIKDAFSTNMIIIPYKKFGSV